MFVTTLISSGHLDPSLVDSLRNAMGGGDALWLDPVCAAEFSMQRHPDDLRRIAEEVRSLGVDMVVQPAEGRRKSILIADMDSTVIGQECIDELADLAGVGDRVKEITARAMNGELDFEGALTERVALLKGLPVDVIDDVWKDRITLTPGGTELIATMRANGAYTALVSGGFTQFTGRVAESLQFDAHRANRLIERDGHLTGDVARPILGREAKVAALREICATQGVPLSAAMAIGDGANDLGMIELAGTGVALHAKPLVAEAAPHRIDHGDLTTCLFLQGYGRDDFRT